MLKVSIIVPVYNVAPYITRCLNSIYNQSYPNIEVIIIDDCGTDNSMTIINSYLTSEQHAITKVIHHHQNQGISSARNTGINNANGEYLYFIDSDDYLTLGGLILHHEQSFPKLHEVVKIDRFQFKIIKMSATKIELVRLKVAE